MTLPPSAIRTSPDIHCLVDDIGANSALDLALEILQLEISAHPERQSLQPLRDRLAKWLRLQT